MHVYIISTTLTSHWSGDFGGMREDNTLSEATSAGRWGGGPLLSKGAESSNSWASRDWWNAYRAKMERLTVIISNAYCHYECSCEFSILSGFCNDTPITLRKLPDYYHRSLAEKVCVVRKQELQKISKCQVSWYPHGNCTCPTPSDKIKNFPICNKRSWCRAMWHVLYISQQVGTIPQVLTPQTTPTYRCTNRTKWHTSAQHW